MKIYEDKIVAHYDEEHDLRRQVPYEIDGVVVKVNNTADANKIPAKTRFPANAIVHKPVPWITPAETVLKAITVQVGRSGVLTPVAELEPVFVAGSTVSRATLHNEAEIHRKGIHIGDTVIIRKAGMVIPEILEVVTKHLPGDPKFDFFAHIGGVCPACGGPIAKEKVSSGDREEVAWRCQNVAGCPAQLTRRIEYFAQRKALDIESLGGIVAEKLVERGLVKEPLDLFELTLEQLGKLNLGTDDEPRIFGEKNAAKILNTLERAKGYPLERWLNALGVANVGETTAHEISGLYQDFEAVADVTNLKLLVNLLEKISEAVKISPDSRKNMPMLQRERIDKEKDYKTLGERLHDDLPSEEINRIQLLRKELKLEIKNLKQLEPAERAPRILEHLKLNDEINRLGDLIKKHGMNLDLITPAKTKSDGPPLIRVSCDIDPVVARSLIEFFDSVLGKKTMVRLKHLGINPKGVKADLGHEKMERIFSGKFFVFTGTLPTLSRDEATSLIRNAGGSVTTSVSKNTDFLLAGEAAGSKLDKAKELEVKILDEATFLEQLNANGFSGNQQNEFF